MNALPKLPIGIQTFSHIRERECLYVDKTKYLTELIDDGKVYFLSRPRRFGKSVTVSTLDALFSGKRELFKGLYAEEFFDRPDYKVHPVIRLDMSMTTTDMGVDALRASISGLVQHCAERLEVDVKPVSPADDFFSLMTQAAKKHGAPVVVLVDEYDKPILDQIYDPELAETFRSVLRNFYVRIKGADEYLRFVFITGISKFARAGVFSAMNNLVDISMNDKYSAMIGYTEEELLSYFDGYIEQAAETLGKTKQETIAGIRDYYDGFSFDGEVRLYNPFSTLNFFFGNARFNNYWFESGSPSFLVQYVKRHDLEVENFRDLTVRQNFASMSEIEYAEPDSFLFQSGYLTVKERKEGAFVLDYPNKEVLSSVASLFLYGKYKAAGPSSTIGAALAEELPAAYDRLLSAVPYDIYAREESKYKKGAGPYVEYEKYPLAESFYHSLLFAMMWAAQLNVTAELHSSRGRSDIEAEKNGRRYIIELKIAESKPAAEKAAEAAVRQIRERGYADRYKGEDVTLIGLAVDSGARRVGGYKIEKQKSVK